VVLAIVLLIEHEHQIGDGTNILAEFSREQLQLSYIVFAITIYGAYSQKHCV